jgi:hypothetical protein
MTSSSKKGQTRLEGVVSQGGLQIHRKDEEQAGHPDDLEGANEDATLVRTLSCCMLILALARASPSPASPLKSAFAASGATGSRTKRGLLIGCSRAHLAHASRPPPPR